MAPPSISSATVRWRTSVPVQRWRYQSLIQSFAYALDPKTGREYLFVGQARASAKGGEVEDMFFHRHLLADDWTVTYLDTVTAREFGHIQNFHVRISAAGNPYIWTGVEQYTRSKTTSTKVGRFRYRAGATLTKSSPDLEYLAAGKGNTLGVVSTSNPGHIVIRRAQSLTDTYTEYLEDDLLDDGALKPLRSFTRVKVPPGPYQGAGADRWGVHIVGGKTEGAQKLWQHRWPETQLGLTIPQVKAVGTQDLTKLWAPTGPNTSGESECAGFIRGELHVGRRFNSVTRRQLGLFSVLW